MSAHRVLFVQYNNPAIFPPLEHSSRILATAGWDVTFLGIEAAGAQNNLEFPAHPNIHLKRLPYSAPGLLQKLHYGRFAAWCLWEVTRAAPCWVIISDPISCPVGVLMKLVPGVRIMYHEHDSPTTDGHRTLSGRMFAWARRSLARAANLCVLPHHRRAELFVEELSPIRKLLVVPNFPRRDEITTKHSRNSREMFVVYYHGNIAPIFVPLSLLEALASLPSRAHLKIIGYETIGNRGYVARMKQEAARVGVLDRCEFLDAMPRYELLSHCMGADVGLGLTPLHSESVNDRFKAGASVKVFDYLACAVPVLVSEASEWLDLCVKPNFGLACDPRRPDSIAEKLRWFMEHPIERRTMGLSGQSRIRDSWNYESAFSPVLEALSSH